MLKRKLLYVGMVVGLFGLGGHAWSAPLVLNGAPEVVGAGAEAEPLIAIEASRVAIVNRIMADHAEALTARALDGDAVRGMLSRLRADQLLAAALVNSLDEVLAIAVQPLASGPALQRFVALPPVAGAAIPPAQAYLVRDAEAMKVVRAADLRLSDSSVVVGYFVPDAATVVVHEVSRATIPLKDGSGSGTNSWIGNVAGGNVASGLDSAVTAGKSNQATAQGAFVGAGTANAATGVSSLVIGGFDNQATATDSLVASGAGNRATGPRSIVIGGSHNLASGRLSFVGGGGRDGTSSTAAGTDAKDNVTSGQFSVVTGGQGNRASDDYAVVAGGSYNDAGALGAAILGGGAAGTGPTIGTVVYDCLGPCSNRVTGSYGTIGGGFANRTGDATGATTDHQLGTVGGGFHNTASGYASTIAGGYSNTASGQHSAVPGGAGNAAPGDYSFAAGRRAKARNADSSFFYNGVFIFSDSNEFDFLGVANNEFAARATGGVRFVTAIDGAGVPTAGVTVVAGGGSWTTLSDRAAKDDLAPIDGRDVLAKVAAMPVYTWRYKTEVSKALHMGPVAQDFHAAFGLGDGDTRITTVDADGVALAAIQGLNQKLDAAIAAGRAKDAEIALLQERVATLEAVAADVQALRAAVVRLQNEGAPISRLKVVSAVH